jgi:hypothetical protein
MRSFRDPSETVAIQSTPPFTMRTTVVFHASQEVKMIDGLKQIRQ